MMRRPPHRAMLSLGLVLLAAASTPAALTRNELADLYAEAKVLFRQANETVAKDPAGARDACERAVRRLERIVNEGGVRNGKLYYNIGNVYFRMGDLGRAMLNYRRAETLIPNDPNLAQSLRFARTRRADPCEPRQQERVLRTVLFWHYDLSKPARSAVFAAAYLILWAGAALRLLVPRAFPRHILAVAALVAAAFIGSLAVEAISEHNRQEGVIVASEVVARKGDGESYQPSFKDPLHAGTEFVLVEDRQVWRHVELPDGSRCWVPSAAIEMVRPRAGRPVDSGLRTD